MSRLQKHLLCPQGSTYIARLNVGKPIPAGDIKTVYARIKGHWVKVGWLCLDCHRFQPASGAIKSNNIIVVPKDLRGVKQTR
jgi:hypothetical protein